jgi:hypothetical protein
MFVLGAAAAALVVAGFVGQPGGAYHLITSAYDSSGGSASGVTGGALFGANYPLVSEQNSIGRKLAIVRLYYHIGDTFPGHPKYRKLLQAGQTVLVSLDSSGSSYTSITDGQENAPILKFMEQLNNDASKYHLGAVYIDFEHEPDNVRHKYLGTPAQFVKAWDHIHALASSRDLDWNDGGYLHWVLILIHNTYSANMPYWPGSSEVDIVGADGYNSAGCGNAHKHQSPWTPQQVFAPLVSFAASHGNMPVFLAEWGSDDVPSGEQANFIGQMQSYVTDNHSIAGAMYWNTHVGNCDYRIQGDSASVSAMATMGKSSALQGQATGG